MPSLRSSLPSLCTSLLFLDFSSSSDNNSKFRGFSCDLCVLVTPRSVFWGLFSPFNSFVVVVVVETNYIIMQKTHECLLIVKKRNHRTEESRIRRDVSLTPLQLPPLAWVMVLWNSCAIEVDLTIPFPGLSASPYHCAGGDLLVHNSLGPPSLTIQAVFPSAPLTCCLVSEQCL